MSHSDTKPKSAENFPASSSLFFGAFCAGLTATLLGAVVLWQYLVNRNVPEPYLDEFFHVRQAQTYCKGQLSEWDPKITTPPGLYFINYLLNQIGAPCTINGLRLTNALFLVAGVFPVAFIYRSSWSTSLSTTSWRRLDTPRLQRWISDAHSALNVALFPPLFFFSGLYYTDIASTAFVLVALMLYRMRETYPHNSSEEILKTVHILVAVILFAQRQWVMMGVSFSTAFLTSWPLRPLGFSGKEEGNAPARNDSNMRKFLCLAGILSLFFRQTNIFWVAIFPAGLSLFDAVRGRARNATSWNSLVNKSAFTRTFYNPLISELSLHDLVASVISMVACAAGTGSFIVSHPLSVQSKAIVNKLAPFMSLVLVFGAFVILNEGIVLGDKSNHVATIHLPQMLYIWPYMAFFSAPLIVPAVLGSIIPPVYRPSVFSKYGSSFHVSITGVAVSLLALIGALGIIHVNTIVHPFTLADNRHYVFYVFRILRLHPTLYYAAAPVYLASAWAVIQTLGIPAPAKPQNGAAPTTAARRGPRLNFLVVWLATTALCLVGAPLVEPRYFILPWVLWRLEVPSPCVAVPVSASEEIVGAGAVDTARSSAREASGRATRRRGGAVQEVQKSDDTAQQEDVQLGWRDLLFSDYRLWLETGWHLTINAVTGYVFLYRGFEWLQEPGQVQRFLW